MNECTKAAERLLAHWNAPGPQHTETLQPELQAAIDHIQHCPRCEGRLGFLVRALSAEVEDPLTCAECEALLPDYVQAQQIGCGEEARWQPVAAHLASCPHCAAAQADLEALLGLAFGERIMTRVQTPAPDLAFLRPTSAPPPAPRPWRLDELGRLIVELTDALLEAVQAPPRQPAYALAGLKSDAPGTLFTLPIPVPEADLDVTIQAARARAAPDRCTLYVQVDIPSRGGWPHLAGTEVTLVQPEGDPLQEWTDAYGEAVFEGVPVEKLGGLVIEVMPGE